MTSRTPAAIARVAVEIEPAHLDRPFDYLVPADLEPPVQRGSRVEVVFAGRRRRGLVTELVTSTEVPASRLQPVRRVFGPHAWMTARDLEIARWAADRYAAPLGDVLRHALPARVVDVERRAARAGWFPPGVAPPPSSDPVPDTAELEAEWSAYGTAGRQLRTAAAHGGGAFYWRPLPDESVGQRLADLIRITVAGGRDALVVVPDPESPAANAVVRAAGDLAVDVRGGPSPRRTYKAWLAARCGWARVVVGERGVAFWPLGRLGLAIVLDEANPALKERRSPRHHAREVALERARRSGACAVLVGFVPSATAWRLLTQRRLTPVVARRDRERAAAPTVRLERQRRPRTRISAAGMHALRAAVADDAYGVVLAARRGEGRALACSRCGRRQRCPVCGASVARSPGPNLHCDVCGWAADGPAACEDCGSPQLVPLAAGVDRLALELSRATTAPVAALEGYGAEPPAPPAVLVMTRGSVLDAPPGPVGAVVLVDFDAMVRRPVLDAAEDTLRLAMQVARWTVATPDLDHPDRAHAGGRGGEPAGGHHRGPARAGGGLVVVETEEPQQDVAQALVRWDPGGFWRAEARARAPLRFPPAAHAIELDAPADETGIAAELAALLPAGDDVLGPLPQGERSTYLIKSSDRVATVAALDAPRRQWSRDRRDIRLDVDPVGGS